MNLIELKQSYQKQISKVTVPSQKVKQLTKFFLSNEFKTVNDSSLIKSEFFSKFEEKKYLQSNFFQHKLHDSVDCKKKRFIDLIGSLIGLLLILIIFFPIALVIKIDSPGSIFYSQIRCGLQGKPFRIWKFRTMVEGAELQQYLVDNEIEGCLFKNKNDPRITRVGKFLRRTSLDELPQFWNVFKGEMSLVGTRPPTLDEVKNYQDRHYKRLLVKPGLTGEWQVYGRSNIKQFDDVVNMDIDYQNKWSFLYDIKLILMTIRVVALGKGAY
jgi:lipopolysaccharide/colanic/teichoic acid biosynthesis glycosyltransferase